MHTLTILSVAGQEPRKLVPVGKEPVALVVNADGTEVYVANRESRTISVVQLPSGKLRCSIPVPGEPVSVALR
jgi:YVTN family beta-propeller protein